MSSESEQSYTDTVTHNSIRIAYVSVIATFVSGAYYALNVKVLPDGTMYQPEISFLIFRVLLAFTFGVSSFAIWRYMKTR